MEGKPPPPEPTQLEQWDGTPRGFHSLGAAWFQPEIAVLPTPDSSEYITGITDKAWNEIYNISWTPSSPYKAF